MTVPIVLSAVVGGSVSFLVVVFVNFGRAARNRKRSASDSNNVWD